VRPLAQRAHLAPDRPVDPCHVVSPERGILEWPELAVLHLVRHGQSTWNAHGRVQGQTPHPALTPTGQAQAQAAADALAATGATRVFTSDLRRAQQTALPIAAVLGVIPIPEPALREQHVGRLQGRTLDRLPARSTSPGRHHPGRHWDGGESVFDVVCRISRFLAGLTTPAPTAPTVLVTHGDVIPVAVSCLRNRCAHHIGWFTVPNGSITTLSAEGGHLQVRTALRHLRGGG